MTLEFTDRGDRSTEGREFCKGEGESASALGNPLVSLLTLGVAGDVLFGVCIEVDNLLGVSDKPDLANP